MRKPMTIKNPKRTLRIFAISIIILLLVFYGYRQANRLITGPSITVFEPIDGASITGQEVTIKGLAENIAFISLNDQSIFVEENGNFSQKLLLSPGYNIITLKARDKFDNETETVLELVSNVLTTNVPPATELNDERSEPETTSSETTTTNN